jgi:TPP-dependent trihydroxycyclohexane-1,2-dione (THcHDO) dehydratase
MATDTDKLYDALKLLKIETRPTDVAGTNAWYAADGTYLGNFTEAQGLAHLKKFTGQVATERT